MNPKRVDQPTACAGVRLPALLIATLAAALAGSGTTRAADVRFVTPIDNCKNKIDQPGDGKNLFVVAGPSRKFEVFGDWMENVTSIRFGTVSGTGTVTTTLGTKRNGAANLLRGCEMLGSVVVTLSSPITLTSNISRELVFEDGSNDGHLPVTIKAFPPITATWLPQNGPACIVGTGSFQLLDQNDRIVINLPPGHQQDHTTCTNPTLIVSVAATNIGEFDVGADPFRYTAVGMPAFLTLATSQEGFQNTRSMSFAIDTARIRALTATSTSTITIRSANTNRTDTVRLTVIPNAGQGFATPCACNPSSFNVGDLTDCNVRLSAPAAGGQVITWRMTTAGCFAQAVATTPYNPGAAFQAFAFPAGQTSANLRVRSATTGAGCADKDGVAHLFEAWIGDFRLNPQVTAKTSGPSYTQCRINVIQPQN